MEERKKLKSVRLDELIVNLVKEHKDKTRVPIGAFFELAALEKLQREGVREKPNNKIE